MATPESWIGEAERLRRFSDPVEQLPEMGVFDAIGYALFETDAEPGFASRAPYFLRALAKAGYTVVHR